MPLKTKRGRLPARSNGSLSKALPKKTVTKSVGKSKVALAVAAKKPGKKAGRARAGYELYSNSDDRRQGNYGRGHADADGTCRTLVEDWIAKQTVDTSCSESESAGSREMAHAVERHYPVDSTTMFNKRLVSSTPDPERLIDNNMVDEQLIPERDTDWGPGGTLARMEKDGAATLLSESERQRVRQQLDAALIEEAQVKNKRLQEQWKGMQKNQQQNRSSSVLPQGQVPVNKRVLAAPQSARAINGTQPAPKSSRTGVLHRHAPSSKNVAAGSAKTTSGDQGTGAIFAGSKTKSAPGMPPVSVLHNVVSGLEARASDIGVFHHFLNRDSADLPACLQQRADVGVDGKVFVPHSTEHVPNMSMGFTPRAGNQTGPFSGLSSGTNPGSTSTASHHVLEPLTIVTDGVFTDVDDHNALPVHIATPACSPVRKRAITSQPPQNSSRNLQFRNGPTIPLPSEYPSAQQTQQGLRTPATSPERDSSQSTFPANSRGQQPQNLSLHPSSSTHNHKPANSSQPNSGAKRKTDAGSYTADGYYINRPVDTGGASGGESPPRPQLFTPTPSHSPQLTSREMQRLKNDSSSGAAQLNINNNSDSDSRQPNMNQNMHDESPRAPGRHEHHGYPASGVHGLMDQARPSREAMAEMDFLGFPFNPKAQMMVNEDELDPPAPACSPMPPAFSNREVVNGPNRLRRLICELKETCEIEGDMEVCHLVQQISDLIEFLPQLKPTFNLETEIGLAIQPLRSECSQLRRRLRILNQQLRERERQEKEGLDPKIQVEILTLQTENMELQKKLTEAEKSCEKLNSFISKQQQELQQLRSQFSKKEHEKLLVRQEDVQQLNRLNQELERMSMRNQSLQSKLSAADCQNSVLDLTLKQRDMEIVRLQDSLGKMKQAVSEVMQFYNSSEGDVSNSNSLVRSLPCFRILHNLLKSVAAFRGPPDYSTTASSQGPLDVSGNQRIVRFSRLDRSENITTSHFNETSQKQVSRDMPHTKGAYGKEETQLPKESSNTKSTPQPRDTSLSGGQYNAGEMSLSENSLSTGTIPPSPLTVAAVAAHNQHLKTMQSKGGNFSFHSWDGGEHQRSLVGNQSLPYHSDPESATFPPQGSRKGSHKPHSRIQQWSTGVDTERQQAAQSLEHSSHLGAFDPLASKNKNCLDGKADTDSETGSVPTLSEIPFSETDAGQSAKDCESESATKNIRHSVTEYFKKYPDTRQTSSALKSPQLTPPKPSYQNKNNQFITPAVREKAADKRSPPISSPNSSLTCSTSNTTQKDYFQGSELDISLSTIPEDGLSSVTGLTGASISTAMSLDDRKFKEGVSALDEKITKVKESLQVWKQAFS